MKVLMRDLLVGHEDIIYVERKESSPCLLRVSYLALSHGLSHDATWQLQRPRVGVELLYGPVS